MAIVDTDDLETKCYACGGSGWIKEPPESEVDVVCAKCGGRGTLLTAVGKQLVGILRKYL